MKNKSETVIDRFKKALETNGWNPNLMTVYPNGLGMELYFKDWEEAARFQTKNGGHRKDGVVSLNLEKAQRLCSTLHAEITFQQLVVEAQQRFNQQQHVQPPVTLALKKQYKSIKNVTVHFDSNIPGKTFFNVLFSNEQDAKKFKEQVGAGSIREGNRVTLDKVSLDIALLKRLYRPAVMEKDKARDHGMHAVKTTIKKFEQFRGDVLKTKILLEFKEILKNLANDSSSVQDFKKEVAKLKESDEYKILQTGQGWATKNLRFLTTSSVKAFDKMVDSLIARLWPFKPLKRADKSKS